MGRIVDLEDLAETADVAELLGLGSATSVATYRRRYSDFPAPVWASRGGRCQLWLRSDVEAWARETGRL
jgi:predicted DNA-binding transcriptional regulator AlpA